MKCPVIEFVDFTFRYASQQESTLRHINLTVFEGEKILILGPSGSGKSTLANCINGLIPFSYKGSITGQCKVAGMETSYASNFSLSKSVGTVLQDSDAQFVGLTVGEDIAFALENQMMPRDEMIPLVLKSANIVGMSDFLGHSPFELSGGQKQKVALGGVLNEQASILLFDEPLASLDPQAGMHAIELIEEIHNQGKTVVIIEHRLEDVLHRGIDRVIVVNEGEIVFNGDVDDLLAQRKLHAYGIREPLYLTQLEYAGCVYDAKDHPSDIETMDLQGVKEKLAAFEEKSDHTKYNKKETDVMIEADHVDFAYTDELVLRDVSFTIHQGEKIAFIGKNGAGKSTMAKLLTGIVRPKHGTIKYKSQDIAAYSIREIGQRIGYVMQNPNQMLVRDIIREEGELALIARKIPADVREKSVEDALTLCGLWSMRNWPVTAVTTVNANASLCPRYWRSSRMSSSSTNRPPARIISTIPKSWNSLTNATAISESPLSSSPTTCIWRSNTPTGRSFSATAGSSRTTP